MKKGRKWISHEELRAELMKDPEFREEYNKREAEFQIARQLIEARLKKKMSQEELAEKANTGQAVVSRLEGANASPSITLLKKLANALGKKLVVQFK